MYTPIDLYQLSKEFGIAAAPETITLTFVHPNAALNFFLMIDDIIGILNSPQDELFVEEINNWIRANP